MTARVTCLVLALALLPVPGTAQDMVFSPERTVACLAGDGGDQPQSCVGTSANACMDSAPGGHSTVGMGYCLEQEWQYWDGRLNLAYQALRAELQAMDAEMRELGSSAPAQADALRAMQRAWIPYRDARCDFERSLWGGGTGGGPATLACLMGVTADQALLLEARRGL